MHKIPVYILSGFLGSGKTTLLLRLLHEVHERGLFPAVLMNELGKLDMDGYMLQSEIPGLSLEKLLDGCICCDKKDEVASSLHGLLLREPDVVFIELTGVANPEEIVDVLSEPSLTQRFQLHKIITVLDAEHALEYNSIFASDRSLVHTLRKQIEVADLILVNKYDLITDKQRTKLETMVRKQNPISSLQFTIRGHCDMTICSNIEANPFRTNIQAPRFNIVKQSPTSINLHEQASITADITNPPRSFSRLQTVTLPYSPLLPLAKSQIERYLQSRSGKLLRAKGYLRLAGDSTTKLVQFAGKRIYWETSNHTGDQYLVLIGIDLDIKSALSEWKRLN